MSERLRPGDFIRERARARGISTRRIADVLDVHPSTVRRTFRNWENVGGASVVKMATPYIVLEGRREWDTFRGLKGAQSKVGAE